jgi:hypothetical protein
MTKWLSKHRELALIVGLFVAFRLMWLMTIPADNLTLFGDYRYYYELAAYSDQGYLPFIHYWSEYPPVFPFLSVAVYQLAHLSKGGYTAYVYLMGLVMLAFNTGSLVLLVRLARRLPEHGEAAAIQLGWVYSVLFVPLVFTWWNFDALTVFFLLLALDLLLSGHEVWSAVAMGVGALVKLIPLLVFPAVVRTRPWRRWLVYGAVAMLVILVVAVPLLIAGGPVALASFRSPGGWSSWETVWALIDGNLRTGLLGAPATHFDLALATQPVGNPPRIPEWLRLLAFGLLYGLIFWKARLGQDPRRWMAFVCATLVVFFLWSKGWSPQWQTLLFPLLLLTLPLRRSVLFILVLSFVNLAEWPVFLSRGMNQWLYLTVLLRTLLFILLLIELVQSMRSGSRLEAVTRVAQDDRLLRTKQDSG